MPESTVSRSLWLLVLLAAITFTTITVLRQPTDSDGSSFGPGLTLWVAGAQSDPDASMVAHQAAASWAGGRRATAAQPLPGGARSAVGDFFATTRTARTATGNLLVVTPSTLSRLAARSAGQLTRGTRSGALDRAPIIAVLARDPLELAVRARSSIHTTAQLLALTAQQPGRAVFGIAADPWLTGNLAALLTGFRLHGHKPYREYQSSTAALSGLLSGRGDAVLAPRTALVHARAADRIRILRWPAGRPPEAWIALAASPDTARAEIRTLRAQGRRLAANRQWRQLLRSEGLTPQRSPATASSAFLHTGTVTADRLRREARRVIGGSRTHR